MNTLSANSIQEALHSWRPFREAAASALPSESDAPVEISGVQGSLHSCFLREVCTLRAAERMRQFQYSAADRSSQAAGPNGGHFSAGSSDAVVVVPGEREAAALKSDLEALFPEADAFILPGWGTLPYRPAPQGSVSFGRRAGVLAKMAWRREALDAADAMRFKPCIFIIPRHVLQIPVPPPDYVRGLSFFLKRGQALDTVEIAERLARSGYIRVPRVNVRGEFSLRGEVLDIFLPEEELPARAVFDFDVIEDIKLFDPENQATVAAADSLLVHPMKEVVWNEELVSRLSAALSDEAQDEGAPRLEFPAAAKEFRKRLLEGLSVCAQAEGEELFYPLLWNKEFSVLDYVQDRTPVLLFDYDRLANAKESSEREAMAMYRKSRTELPVLPPSEMTLEFGGLVERVKRCIKFRTLFTEKDSSEQSEGRGRNSVSRIEVSAEPSRSYFGNIAYLREEFQRMQQDGWKIFVFADNENQALRIREILKEFIELPAGSAPEAVPVAVFGSAVSEGFAVPELKLRVIQENEIFGRKKYIPKSLHRAKSKALDTFVELNPGDFVVHVSYGIGVFRGIERVRAMGNERDYIRLEYADEEFVFVPIEQVNLVQRYIGSEGAAPHLDRIGSKAWENRKNKVRREVEDLARKLIDLYSRRKASAGFPFPPDTEWQTMFEAAFPYEDTPDQIVVTEEVKRDMEKPVPMDRLICGDVGYGKTEIAMRAAFKAVLGGKQVAFLAPTTILAEQHYESCVERFHSFPVRIAHLSRFVQPSEQKKILSEAAEGKIDILIGTHRVIQKDVAFKNLGLMIIDEEQRFGVKDKERLKVLKNNIDCLALSATPIPRTLHMSLLKIRDMSLLATPPQNRQPVETVIEPFSDGRIAAAIRKEVERGGQVFYLHNRVESLGETRARLERLLPEMLIDAAHGQMTGGELDDIFRRFKMGGFHVLVATTIIENGIDIPNVNTIIIDRADMYGVSQLYQLRGRVGRSDRKAYAYLLYPENRSLSEIAMKRLQVISDFTELGSGFKIAMKDMEIRGAGNLLGRDQSGNFHSVGFDMYMRLLDDAVSRLTAQDGYQAQMETLLELEYSGFIPDTYVQNAQTKMEIYKKIAAVQEQAELDSVYNELLDRFGPVPEEAASLLALAEIRVLCRRLKIASVKERNGVAAVEFAAVSDISIDKVLNLIASSAGTVKLNQSNPNTLFLMTGRIGLREKSEFIREKLERLA